MPQIASQHIGAAFVCSHLTKAGLLTAPPLALPTAEQHCIRLPPPSEGHRGPAAHQGSRLHSEAGVRAAGLAVLQDREEEHNAVLCGWVAHSGSTVAQMQGCSAWWWQGAAGRHTHDRTWRTLQDCVPIGSNQWWSNTTILLGSVGFFLTCQCQFAVQPVPGRVAARHMTCSLLLLGLVAQAPSATAAGSIPLNPDALFYSGGVRQAALNWSKELGAPDVIIDPSPRDDYFTQMMTSRWAGTCCIHLLLCTPFTAGGSHVLQGVLQGWRSCCLASWRCSASWHCVGWLHHQCMMCTLQACIPGWQHAACTAWRLHDNLAAPIAGTACRPMALAGASAQRRLWWRAACR